MQTSEMQDLTVQLLPSSPDSRGIRAAIHDLFAEDGTVYLVVGFFTYNGFHEIKDEIATFLERSPENNLYVVVGPSSDQFSSRIARELWSMSDMDQVHVLKYSRGLHAKLYLRDGPNPHVILGSANLTRVAYRYNLELGIELAGPEDHEAIESFIDWAEWLVAEAQPMTRADLLFPVQLMNAVINWSNKARLLPPRHIAKRVTPIIVLMILVTVLAGMV